MSVIPELWEAKAGGSLKVGVNPISQIAEVSWVWWCVPVIPAIGEVEAGESLKRKFQ